MGAVGALTAVGQVAASNARGAMLGLVAGLLAIGALLAAQRRWTWLAPCAALLALAVALNAPRVKAIADVGDDTARVRLGLWKGTLHMAAAHPIVGCGAGNFRFAFPPYRDEGEFAISNRGASAFPEAREPHSTPLAVLAQTGPVGFAAFIALLVLAAASIARGPRDVPRAVAAGGLAAYAVAGLFNTLGGFAPFDVVAGALFGLAAPEGKTSPSRALPVFAASALGAALLALLAVYSVIAEARFTHAMKVVDTPPERAEWLLASLRMRERWEARRWLGDVFLRTGDSANAVREYRRALALNPHHVPMLQEMAQATLAEGNRDGAIAFLRQAERLQPNYWMTHHNLGGMLGSRDHYLRAIALNPGHGKSYYFLGTLALGEGNRAEAADWFAQAKQAGVPVGRELRRLRPDLESDPLLKPLFVEERK
jgi:tetratricopeptide (TPR) repeat protein